MPTYEYACTACDERLEVVQKFSDDPLTECPQCQGRLRKVFSPVGVVFKGSGFYRTDSRKGAGSGAKSGAKSGATSSSSGSGDGASSSSSSASSSASSSTSTSSNESSTPAKPSPATSAA